MSRQFWSETLAWAVTDGATLGTSTAETIVFPNVTIPANYLQDGRRLRLTAYGELSTSGAPTVQFFCRWGGVGGTLLAKSAPITNGATVASVSWNATVNLQVRSNGSAGTIFAVGEASVMTSNAAGAAGAPNKTSSIFGSAGTTSPVAVTVDLTADMALAFSAQWGSSGGITLIGHDYTIEALN